jgi:hypothetical protein
MSANPYDPDTFNAERFAADQYNLFHRLYARGFWGCNSTTFRKQEWRRAKDWANCGARVDPAIVEARIKIIVREDRRAHEDYQRGVHAYRGGGA